MAEALSRTMRLAHRVRNRRWFGDDLFQRRNAPIAFDEFGSRHIGAQREAHRSARGGQPVGSQCAFGSIALDQDDDTAVGFAYQPWCPVPDRIASEGIFDEIIAPVRLCIIHGQRPEGVGRNAAGRQAPAVVVGAVQPLAAGIEVRMEIHRLLLAQRGDASERDHRAQMVVGAEIADAPRLIAPAVDDQVAEQKALPQVSDTRWQIGRPSGEEGGRGRRRFGADAERREAFGAHQLSRAAFRPFEHFIDHREEIGGIARFAFRAYVEAPRRRPVGGNSRADLLLQRFRGRKVVRSIDENAREHPGIVGGRLHKPNAIGHLAIPIGADDPDPPAFAARRTRFQIGEIVGERVHERDREIAIAHRRDRHVDRPTRKLKKQGGINGVVVGGGDVARAIIGELRALLDAVERSRAADGFG
nr:hypothetical protein [Sphingopyxis terrae]